MIIQTTHPIGSMAVSQSLSDKLYSWFFFPAPAQMLFQRFILDLPKQCIILLSYL